MKKENKLYVAYGSNLNKEQMKYRCPNARLIGTSMISDYELQFKGYPHGAFATIVPKADCSVPVAVWEITDVDEERLDIYEGFPNHYFKQKISVMLDNTEVSAMVYIMNLKKEFGIPSKWYYETVCQGYIDCNLPVCVLDNAVEYSKKEYYKSQSSQIRNYSLSPLEEDESEDYNDFENCESDDEEWKMKL